MGFSNGAFAKIKEVDIKENFTKAKIVISKRVNNSNPAQYICTYAGWVSMVGKAHNCRPMAGQKIKITNCDVTNGYADKVTGQQKFMNSPKCTIFEYELQQGGVQGNDYTPSAYLGGSQQNSFADIPMDDTLPFQNKTLDLCFDLWYNKIKKGFYYEAKQTIYMG